ncbi:recombinase family protein [Streptomyces sp. NPDC002205]|uniref:zinc finger domain-containing protein n=1 Tax=Streptomyces sp. NPDC002205 TaxID=3154411 RepID=UPI0033242A6F
MDLAPDQAALAVEHHDCPNCDALAGSACRTRGGQTAAKYHTPRFVLVPALREELEIPVPADRGPGRAWKQGPTLAVVPAPSAERPIRIGYARTSTARQELASQLEALHRAQCHKVFKEQIGTRIKVRPELEKAPNGPSPHRGSARPVGSLVQRPQTGGKVVRVREEGSSYCYPMLARCAVLKRR